jgi:hypothetical protein
MVVVDGSSKNSPPTKTPLHQTPTYQRYMAQQQHQTPMDDRSAATFSSARPPLPPPGNALEMRPLHSPTSATTPPIARYDEDADREFLLRQRPSVTGVGTSTGTGRSTDERPRLVNVFDREQALRRWLQTGNWDRFFDRVYEYYVGQGIYCILLQRVFNLL